MSPSCMWVNQLLMVNTQWTRPPQTQGGSSWAERSHDWSSPDMSHCAYKRRPLSSAALWLHFICSMLHRMDCWASQSAHSGKDSHYISYGKENTVWMMIIPLKREVLFSCFMSEHWNSEIVSFFLLACIWNIFIILEGICSIIYSNL